MNKFSLGIAALAFVAATAASAVEATRFEVPAGWTKTRIEVQAEARRAAAADEIGFGEAGKRFGDPAAEPMHGMDRTTTVMPRNSPDHGHSHGHGERNIAGDFAVGGM